MASGVLDLLAAAAAVAVGPDGWFTTAAGVGLGVVGANAVIDAFQESHRRTGEVARIREYGADEVDTLTGRPEHTLGGYLLNAGGRVLSLSRSACR
jgi:hypothetical protein